MSQSTKAFRDEWEERNRKRDQLLTDSRNEAISAIAKKYNCSHSAAEVILTKK